MSQEEFNLFSSEDALVAEARAYLETTPLDPASRETVSRLFTGYQKLLRETKQLIKISDRREKELNRLNRRLEQLTNSLAYQADHDTLTGLFNKGATTRQIEEALGVEDFSLLLFDVDHFKVVNDSHGHLVGDLLLRGLAELVQESLGQREIFGRFGGEEFIVLMPQSSLLQARVMAERLRTRVAEHIFECGDHHVRITISIGLTLCRVGEPFDSIYRRVDSALYTAKRSGRNRVEVGDNTEPIRLFPISSQARGHGA